MQAHTLSGCNLCFYVELFIVHLPPLGLISYCQAANKFIRTIKNCFFLPAEWNHKLQVSQVKLEMSKLLTFGDNLCKILIQYSCIRDKQIPSMDKYRILLKKNKVLLMKIQSLGNSLFSLEANTVTLGTKHP